MNFPSLSSLWRQPPSAGTRVSQSKRIEEEISKSSKDQIDHLTNEVARDKNAREQWIETIVYGASAALCAEFYLPMSTQSKNFIFQNLGRFLDGPNGDDIRTALNEELREKPIDISGMDLSGLNFSGLQFHTLLARRTNFAGANLAGLSVEKEADFSSSVFTDADCTGTCSLFNRDDVTIKGITITGAKGLRDLSAEKAKKSRVINDTPASISPAVSTFSLPLRTPPHDLQRKLSDTSVATDSSSASSSTTASAVSASPVKTAPLILDTVPFTPDDSDLFDDILPEKASLLPVVTSSITTTPTSPKRPARSEVVDSDKSINCSPQSSSTSAMTRLKKRLGF